MQFTFRLLGSLKAIQAVPLMLQPELATAVIGLLQRSLQLSKSELILLLLKLQLVFLLKHCQVLQLHPYCSSTSHQAEQGTQLCVV